MTTGRIRRQDLRVYVDGYDLSGYSRSIGELACTFDEGIDDAVTLPVKQTIPGMAMVSMGTLNGLFDNTATSGIHVIMDGAGIKRTVLVAQGIQAAPADNDPSFCGEFEQGAYTAGANENPITLSIPFESVSARASNLWYARPWGVLLHAKAAETDVNAATGLDQAASSALGGFMCYQVFSSDGTATIKVQHAATNSDGDFADLLSSGSVDFTGGGLAGIVQLDPTTSVDRYVRWQIALGTATTITFALSFNRG